MDKLSLHDIRLPILSYTDINDRFHLILNELIELRDALEFIIKLQTCKHEGEYPPSNPLDLAKEFSKILIKKSEEALDALSIFKEEIIKIAKNSNNKLEFDEFFKKACQEKKIKNKDIPPALKSTFLIYLIRKNENISKMLRIILELQQLINEAEAQNVDVLPDQFILPPRTHYRRTFKIVEINNQVRYFYTEAILTIINQGIFNQDYINDKEKIIKTNLISYSHRLVSIFRNISGEHTRENYPFGKENENNKNFIINSPFWFLASPRYLPILAHEIAHASLPSDIFKHSDDIRNEILEPLEECSKEINYLYSIDEEIIINQPIKPMDDLVEMLADVIALLAAGPYYIYSLFNSYLGKSYSIEQMINFRLFNIFIRIEVLLNIVKKNIYINPGKPDLIFDQLVIEDLNEMEETINSYKLLFEKGFDVFKNEAKSNYEFYYLYHEKAVHIFTFYFGQIVKNLLNNDSLSSILFKYQKFSNNTPEEYFRTLIHSIYLFSVIKRLAFFQDHAENEDKNKNIEDYLKTTEFNLLNNNCERDRCIKLNAFFNNKHYISMNTMQNLPHLIWMSTLLQNKIDIYLNDNKENNGNLLYKELKKIKNDNNIENIINNLKMNDKKTDKTDNINILYFLDYNYIEVPFLKVIYQYYKILKNFKQNEKIIRKFLRNKPQNFFDNFENNIIEIPEKFKYQKILLDFYNKYHKVNLFYLTFIEKKEIILKEKIFINNFDDLLINIRNIENLYLSYKEEINNFYTELTKIKLIHRGLKLFYFFDYYFDFKKENETFINFFFLKNKDAIKKNNNENLALEENNNEEYVVIGHFDLLRIVKHDYARKMFDNRIEHHNNNANSSNYKIPQYSRNIENEEIFVYYENKKEKANNFNKYIKYDDSTKDNSPFLALSSIRFTRLPDQSTLYLEGDMSIKLLLYKVKEYNIKNEDEKRIGIKSIYKSNSWHDIYIIWKFKKLIYFKQFFSDFLTFPGNTEKFISNSITYLLFKKDKYFLQWIKNNKIRINEIIKTLNHNYNQYNEEKKSEERDNNTVTLISYGKTKHDIFKNDNLNTKGYGIPYYKTCKFISINNAFGRHDIDIKWDFCYPENGKEVTDNKLFYLYLCILSQISITFNIYRFETTFLSTPKKKKTMNNKRGENVGIF